MDDDLGLLSFGGIQDVAPLEMGDVGLDVPTDDALQAAYQDWLGAGNEGSIQDFLTTQDTKTPEVVQDQANLAPIAFADKPFSEVGTFKPGEFVGLDKAAFASDAALGGTFGSNAARAASDGAFTAPANAPMAPLAPLPAVAPLDELFPESAVPSWYKIGTSIGPDIQGPTMPGNLFQVRDDLSGSAPFNLGPMDGAKGLVVHHTGGGGTPQGIMDVFNQRGLATQYIMDRDGSVYRALADGTRGRHMRPSEVNDLSNQNTVGIEVIAKNDADVTPEQRFGMRNFTNYATERYGIPQENVFGHGELNSHKQATEGMSSVAQWREYKGFGNTPFGGATVADAGANRPMAGRTLMAYAGRDDGGSQSAPPPFQSEIAAASRETGIPENVLRAKIQQESGFRPNAVGRAGEVGLTQIMPSTAADPGYGIKPLAAEALRDPAQNIMFGARYLEARGRAAGVTDWNDPKQVAAALTAYNGGGDPNYAQNVMRYMADGNVASRSAASDRMRNISPMSSQSTPLSRGGAAAELPSSDMNIRAPSPMPRVSGATAQGRPTMAQITPDEELYSLGMIRDPAGGGMIENVAIRPPGMVMGADGAYIDAGSDQRSAPASVGAPSASFGGGFGGIMSSLFGGGNSGGPRSDGGGLPPRLDAFLGAASAALMSGNGAAFAPTFQAILDSADGKAKTAREQSAIATFLQKQGLLPEEAAIAATSPRVEQMMLGALKDQRSAQQNAEFNRMIGAVEGGGTQTAPRQTPVAPSAPSVAPSTSPQPSQEVAQVSPSTTRAEEKTSSDTAKQQLLARRDQYAKLFGAAPNDVARQNVRVRIDSIDAQIKALDANKPERDSFREVKDADGNIVGRFNTRSGETEPVQPSPSVPKIAPKVERDMKDRNAAADRLELKGDERKFYLANGRVPSAGEKLTEQQSKDIVFYNRGRQALDIFDAPVNPKDPKSPKVSDVFSTLEGSISKIGDSVPVVGGFLATQDYKKADQSGRNFLASILRKDSGAAVTPSEMDQYGRIFFPRVNDGADVLKQKAEARKQALEAIKAGLNPFAESKLVKTEGGTTQPPRGEAAPSRSDLEAEARRRGLM